MELWSHSGELTPSFMYPLQGKEDVCAHHPQGGARLTLGYDM